MKNYKVTFQYSETIYCSNIARAESKEEVEKYYSKYAWYKVNEATEWDIKEAEMESMPVITIERKEEKKMSKKVNITEVRATENGYTVTYETGSVKKYAADKLPGTVKKWMEEHQEPETEPEITAVYVENGCSLEVRYSNGTAEFFESLDDLPEEIRSWLNANGFTYNTEDDTTTEETAAEPEQEEATEITTTDEPKTMRQNKGAYDRALLEITKRRERRDIFRNLETIGLMVLGVGYLITAAIVTALAAAVIWIAERIPAMVQTGRQAATKAAAAISTTVEIVEDTAKAFAHAGRKAATVATAVLTMITR